MARPVGQQSSALPWMPPEDVILQCNIKFLFQTTEFEELLYLGKTSNAAKKQLTLIYQGQGSGSTISNRKAILWASEVSA